MKTLVAGVLIIALATTAWILWPASSPQNPSEPNLGKEIKADSNPDAETRAKPKSAEVATPTVEPNPSPEPDRLIRTPEPRANAMVYPDGLMLPALNGVTGKTTVTWPPGMPYTSVIEKQTMADGTEWYLHEGGVWTSTFYSEFTRDGKRWRQSVGRTLLERPDLANIKKN